MPVTARLSQRFYERFGDDVANELVDWMNAVDTSYRAEFRELFEAHFGQVRAEMGTIRAEMAQLRTELKAEVAAVRSEMAQLEARIDAKLADLKSELLRWMFLFWLGTIGAVMALLRV